MADNHGVRTEEIPFQPVSSSDQSFAAVFAIGTAPVNLSKLAVAPVNVPVLVESWTDAVNKFGYSEDWESFTLSEFFYAWFQLYNRGPVVVLNVLDPATHTTAVADQTVLLVKGRATINAGGVLLNTVQVRNADGTTTYVRGTDYTLVQNDVGSPVISRIGTGTIGLSDSLRVSYTRLDGTKVTAEDVIGGQDVATGAATGLDALKNVMGAARKVPSLIVAPGFSEDPLVAAVMVAKAKAVNNRFKCSAVTDIPATVGRMDLETWKADNGYTGANQYVTWPLVTYKGKRYHLSSVFAARKAQLDEANDFIPFESPSNKGILADGAILGDGTPLFLGPEEGEAINALGIVTAINFVNGWTLWGNRTAAYPSSTSPQDSMIPVREMFNWVQNSLIVRYWSRIDDPMNRRLIDSIVDDANIWLNTLTGTALLGASVAFERTDNPVEQLANGKIVFRIKITPPSAAQDIVFLMEYDAGPLETLFTEGA